MRVRLESTWFAGHPDYDDQEWSRVLNETAFNLDRTIVPKAVPGGAATTFCDGGSLSVVMAFTVLRTFATPSDVVAFLADHGAADPASGVGGTIYYRLDGPRDGDWAEVYSAGGVITLNRATMVGAVVVKLEYVAKGGPLVAGAEGNYINDYFAISEDDNFIEITIGGVVYSFPAEPLGTATGPLAPAISGDFIIIKIDGADYRLPAVPLGTNAGAVFPHVYGDLIRINIGGADYSLPLVP